jgi:hypothetical protein
MIAFALQSIILIILYWNKIHNEVLLTLGSGILNSKRRFRFETVSKVTIKGKWLYVCHFDASVGIYPAHLPQYTFSPITSPYRDS